MRNWLIVIALLFSLSSCEWLNSLNETREPVARVKEQYLFKEDVLALMPELLTKQDSSDFIKNFSEKWVEEQIMIDRASINLNEGLTDIDRKVTAYKKSLLIYAYEQAVVRQSLDTNFSVAQIRNYYNKHKEDFILRDDVYRLLFLKLDKNTPRLSELKEWFDYTDREEKLSLLNEYAVQFALDYSLNDKSWWKGPDIIKRIPVQTDSLFILSSGKRIIELSKDGYLYIIEVIDHKAQNSAAPSSLVENTIRDIMLNDRKVKLVKELRKDLIEDGQRKNHIDYYEIP